MNTSSISLGFSPCPNDTFIFDAMVHDATANPRYDVVMEDVETLNAYALEGRLDVSKMSFATYFQVMDQYQLLSAGSALGFGVGPILVANSPLASVDLEDLPGFLAAKRIGVPGRYTTAHLLLQLLYPEARAKVFMPFDEIMGALHEGTIDVGLLIHEGRFTYQDSGLYLVRDLGEAYQDKSGLPVPLGGIAIKRSLAASLADKVNGDIKQSLAASWAAYPHVSAFVRQHAQELDEDTMRKHIALYVNSDTQELSAQALDAIAAFGHASKYI